MPSRTDADISAAEGGGATLFTVSVLLSYAATFSAFFNVAACSCMIVTLVLGRIVCALSLSVQTRGAHVESHRHHETCAH